MWLELNIVNSQNIMISFSCKSHKWCYKHLTLWLSFNCIKPFYKSKLMIWYSNLLNMVIINIAIYNYQIMSNLAWNYVLILHRCFYVSIVVLRMIFYFRKQSVKLMKISNNWTFDYRGIYFFEFMNYSRKYFFYFLISLI